MAHVITTYGGGELFTLVFDAIAALFKADRTGMVMSLIRIGLMVGSVYVVMLMFFKSSLQEGAKWFLWVVVATNLLFLPKTTVYIDDPLTKIRGKVDRALCFGSFCRLCKPNGACCNREGRVCVYLAWLYALSSNRDSVCLFSYEPGGTISYCRSRL